MHIPSGSARFGFVEFGSEFAEFRGAQRLFVEDVQSGKQGVELLKHAVDGALLISSRACVHLQHVQCVHGGGGLVRLLSSGIPLLMSSACVVLRCAEGLLITSCTKQQDVMRSVLSVVAHALLDHVAAIVAVYRCMGCSALERQRMLVVGVQ